MNWIDIGKIHAMVISTFDSDELGRLLKYRFSVDMSQEVGNVGFKKVTESALDKAWREGWLSDFLVEVAKQRPRRADVQAVCRAYASDLLGLVRNAQVDDTAAQAYANFGLAPELHLQKQGVQSGTASANAGGLEKTLREDLGYFDPVRFRDQLFRFEGRVCRVELNNATGTRGTAFLVGQDVVLTNYHVLMSAITGNHPASAIRFRFDFKRLPNGDTADGMLVDLAAPNDPQRPWLLGYGPYSEAENQGTPDAAPPAAGQLDYALVRLARSVGTDAVGADRTVRGWIEIPATQPALAGLPMLFILQHPRGGPLQLAFDTQPQVTVQHGGLRVRYAINTEGGSSGSPVFDRDWKLVALHHYGDPDAGHPRYNQGVPIGAIRDHLNMTALAALGGPIT